MIQWLCFFWGYTGVRVLDDIRYIYINQCYTSWWFIFCNLYFINMVSFIQATLDLLDKKAGRLVAPWHFDATRREDFAHAAAFAEPGRFTTWVVLQLWLCILESVLPSFLLQRGLTLISLIYLKWRYSKTFFIQGSFHILTYNSSHLKMDGWNTIVSFWGPAYFQGLC